MQRRDRIGQAYYAAIAPLADFALDAGGTLTFVNEAARSRVLPNATTGYTARWARFDNATGTATAFGESSSQAEARLQAPAGLGSTPAPAPPTPPGSSRCASTSVATPRAGRSSACSAPRRRSTRSSSGSTVG
jgi:hypothetical protein